MGFTPFLKFSGSIKINSLATFQKKIKNLNIDLGDYEFIWGVEYIFPAWIYCIFFVIFIVSFGSGSEAIGWSVGIAGVIGGILLFYYCDKLAKKEVNNIPKRLKKVFDSIVDDGKKYFEDVASR